MNEDAVGLSMTGLVLRRRWRLLVVCAAAGALLGAGASLVFSPGYETSASVLLQGPRDPDELLTEAQVAKSSVVLDRTAAGLRWGMSGTELADEVTSSVTEGNIIEISGRADTPERAKELADRVAQEYVTFSTQLLSDTANSAEQVTQEQQQTLRQQVLETNQSISDLHASAGEGNTIDSVGVRTELESLRSALSQAMTKLDEIDAASSQAKMVVMGPAERPVSPAAPTMAHLAGGGAAAFFLIGLFGHLLAVRTDRRLRGEKGIVAALGADALGAIDVPDEPATSGSTVRASPLTRVRRFFVDFFVDDRPWYVPDPPAAVDEAGLDVRYRRVIARLPKNAPVLVVAADDDPAAGRAAGRLARIAAGDRGGPRARVVEVSARRPVVPDVDEATAGVLVVVTEGTRTAWELVGINEACVDAGHDVVGVVITHRTRPLGRDRPSEERSVPVDGVMAGST